MSTNDAPIGPETDQGRETLFQIGGDGSAVYEQFSPAKLSRERLIQVFSLFRDYHETGNVYYAMSAYVNLVSDGFAPPVWVLNALMPGFAKHLLDPEPKKLARQLGISGHGSGSTSPLDQYKRRRNRFGPMCDMYSLIAD